MDYASIFFTCMVIWYFGNYFNPYILFMFLEKLAQETNNTLNFIQNFNNLMISDIFSDNSDNIYDSSDTDNDDIEITKTIPKYEDKYLAEYRKMDKEFMCDETEQTLKNKKYNEFLKEISNS